MQHMTAQLVECSPMVQVVRVRFSPHSIFLFSLYHIVYNGFEDHTFCFLFEVFDLFFFSFFILSYWRTREVQLVSQRERLKIYQYVTTDKLYALSK
jgi:hypothetical protein